MSDTPRTDAVESSCSGNCMGREWVESDFARTLERELSSVKEELKQAYEALLIAMEPKP